MDPGDRHVSDAEDERAANTSSEMWNNYEAVIFASVDIDQKYTYTGPIEPEIIYGFKFSFHIFT